MGNGLQCCHTISNYMRGKEAPAMGGGDRSPLLSTEGSDCDWLTLLDDQEDDLLTFASPSIPAVVERDHFLFPDILLSSGLGGDGVPVAPMVCLLVSEEEEDEGRRERRVDGGSRLCAEVETQTEVGGGRLVTGLWTQTQNQAEVQTQTDVLTWRRTDDAFGGTRNESKTPEGASRYVCTAGEIQTFAAGAGMGTRSETCPEGPLERGVLDGTDPQPDVSKKAKRQGRKDASEEELVCGELNENDSQNEPSSAWTERDSDVTASGRYDQISVHQNVMNVGMRGKETSANVGNINPVDLHFQLSEGITLKPRQSVAKQSSETLMEQNARHTQLSPVLEEEATFRSTQKNDPIIQSIADIQERENDALREGDVVQTEDSLGETETNTTSDTVSAEQNPSRRELLSAQPGPEAEPQEVEPRMERTAAEKEVTSFLVDRRFLTPRVQAPPGRYERGSVLDSSEQPRADEQEVADIQEVVDLHQTVFTLHIQAPGMERFELQISGQMLVAELHQALMDHEITCHRTCFSLQLGGAVLDSLTELHSVPGLQEGAPINLVEESYTVRDARLHVRHVRDLLRSLDVTDAHNGVNGCSLSYLSLYTQGTSASERESVESNLPECILPGCKERPLTPLQPIREDWKPLLCLRVLAVNSWNPPPGNRKMHGDLMYLNVVTMEGRDLNITSSTRGFYLNQSTAFTFNPKPALPKIVCHSLVELLSQISPVFRKNFSSLQKKRVSQHPYERIATPYQVYTWVAPQADPALECVKAEETPTSRVGQDEHTVGQPRDWNEELQGCRELPRRSLEERLQRERNIFKTNSDFVYAATQGAIAVVDGNVMAINPREEPRKQMFVLNNLFFSLGVDISDHYRPLGGDAAAHAAALCDLRGVQAYSAIDIEGLHTLGTAVVDYHGHRVIAQTIVPGILEKSQEQNVIYGSNDYGQTVLTHPKFVGLLDKTCGPLRIQRHKVLDHKGGAVDLCSCVETKGFVGNDGRHYILDLLRTFPPDLNFLLSERGETVPEECKRFGYPRQHPHSLASLRPELIEAFVQHRYELFLDMVSTGLGKLLPETTRVERPDSAGSSLSGDTPLNEGLIKTQGQQDGVTAVEDMESQRRRVTLDACKAVGSVSETHFDISFNPDVCSSGVRIPTERAEEALKQKDLLWDAAAFLLSNQIPAVLQDFLNHTAVPMDGGSLTAALHRRGVNIRYLGSLLQSLETVEERERLSHVQRIAISEAIVRSTKRIFRIYLQDVEAATLSAAVSHFLNCLLSSASSFPDSAADELLGRRRSRRRRCQGNRVSSLPESAWARMTPGDLWRKIKTEAEDYYHVTLQSESMDDVVEKFGLQKISLLREIAMRTGIQVRLRDYVFESRHRPVFSEEDVVNMSPVVKHLKPTAMDATRLMQRAQTAVQQGLLRDGYALTCQALSLFSSVLGIQHEEVSGCLRLLARITYIMGEYADALGHQEKVVMCSERVQGLDHPQTIQDYMYMALYCFAGGQPSVALRLLYRARYLTLLVSGEDHPQVVQLDSMLGLVLHGLMNYELSLKFLQNSLKLTMKYDGDTSLKCAHSHHLLATLYESKGEFCLALQHEKEAYSIYKSQAGEDHESTKESSDYLKSLTKQAVILQKALNRIYSDAPIRAYIPPPQFSTPSLRVILQQLNVTCGIVLIPQSEKEIADLKTELKRVEQNVSQKLDQ